MRPARLAAILIGAALCLAPAAVASTTPKSSLPIHLQPAPTLFPAKPQRSESNAVARFLAAPKVHDWVGRYPKASLVTQALFHKTTRDWTVDVWSGPAGEIATGRVD